MFLAATAVQAQISIGGNVYGGGNAGNTDGSTTVTVHAGDISAVYGGARMANVGGSTFVNIDGAHASEDILIANVYGGNDISGAIGKGNVQTTVPAELENFEKTTGVKAIDNSWKTFIRTSPCSEKHSANIEGKSVSADKYMVVIGTLYGAGNGDYVYKDGSGNNLTDGNGNFIVQDASGTTVATSKSAFSKPELGKTYLELKGGCIAHVYGGGNAATVTSNTTIHIDNSSDDLQKAVSVWRAVKHPEESMADLFEYLKSRINISDTQSDLSSMAFNFARVFGGNNKADMAIRPRWNLKNGIIRDLYGGGNEGRMTSHEGLLLQIEGEGMTVQNVYGGCRKADVRPLYNNNDDTPVPDDKIELDPSDNPNNIPGGYAARVRVLRGHVTNVYGGNDISGNVYGGNTVGIFTRIYGNVYGGGNGSYAYTDNPLLKDDPDWRDFYYDPEKILQEAGETGVANKLKSATALNIFRPNAEKVSILVRGEANKPVVVDGALYVGGNSASLRKQTATRSSNNRQTHIKIGSYVTIDNVFLGNNGENMVKYNEANATLGINEGVLRTYSKYVKADGTLVDTQVDGAIKFSSMALKDPDVFAKYMEGCAMKVNPTVQFESIENGDARDYVHYSTKFGSFFCGGNVGSILVDGKITVDFEDDVIIYDKVVGGCNNANVYQTDYNAQYLGGMLGDTDPVPEGSPEGTIGDKLELNFAGLKIQPMRWKMNGNDYALDENGNRILEWNTVDSRTFDPVTKKYAPMAPVAKDGDTTYDPDNDPYRRFQGGNIYGGCYSSGHVNGNVIINLNASLVDRKGDNAIFDEIEENEGEAKLYDGNYNVKKRNTGVLLGEQGMDPLGRGLNVFGGGYGGDSEIWGSTTINLNAGYTFQIFGGGEQGAIGNAISHAPDPTDPTKHNLEYDYDERYSTYIHLKDRNNHAGTYRGDTDNSDEVIDYEDMAEAEFIYGGSFEGLIAGSTHIYLGNGRIFNTFAGSCNADILGHTETYVGRNSSADNDLGFPWIRDHIYGGNDLGGRILGTENFMSRVSPDIQGKVYNPKGKKVSDTDSSPAPDVVKASAYTEYIQGRVEYIFGGCYGDYDYTDDHYKAYAFTKGSTDKTDDNLGTMRSGYYKPWMENAFVNFKPNNAGRNAVAKIYGAGQGHAFSHVSDRDGDAMQDRSYVLIDVPQNVTKYVGTEVFGAGDYSGVGMRNAAATTRTVNNTAVEIVPALNPTIAQNNADGVTASAVIDLMRGHLKDVYGASYKEGITRRTIVNVPIGSTIHLNRIFGGAYGLTNVVPCDVFEANINYNSADAIMQGYWIDEDLDEKGNLMSGGIYGGNNNARRTLYSKININSLVYNGTTSNGEKYSAKVFGAGYGKDTWAQYTEVNLNNGASVYEVYGGGYGGMVLNKQSVDAFNSYQVQENNATVNKTVNKYLPTGYTDQGLDCYLVRTNPLGEKTNTNVYINRGSYVAGYCYGAGLGADATVSGTTYIGLHGGTVSKDLYAAGWGGPVYDKYKVAKDEDDENDFVATTNAYIEGGTARNVYGGGYQGAVGYHDTSTNTTTNDISGRTNVVIGIRSDQSDENLINALKPTLGDNATKSDYNFYCGIPAIQRNAYGGGEGGSVFGTSNLTLRNGYIGYIFENEAGKTYANYSDHYIEKIHDETWSDHLGLDRLSDCGNLFGGGYDDNSSVDYTNVTVWGGIVRNGVFGGGEIATVGRGKVLVSGEDNKDRQIQAIYMAGKTHIEIYNGHIKRNVFGGGKGYNILGFGGTRGLYTDGFVFGGTEVFVHGGEIGTEAGLAEGYGNVFGGGDVGYVYSGSYFTGTHTENTGSPNHVYYKDADGNLTEDCKVVIAPMLQIRANGTDVTYPMTGDNQKTYHPYDYVPTDYLNTLPADKSDTRWTNLYTGSKTGDDLTERGIHIRNAVFAGGNVSSNSESYNNATTVFGNTTATLYDVFHHDFITVGTEHTGGLYGGGNLSLVGGYRELNITNYGTDYYDLNQQISLEEYQQLTNRERAYFKLQYVCQLDNNGHTVGEKIDEDEYNRYSNDYKNETYWKQFGFCSIYAGRLLNTIQRADFCGVFGSRLVLQGAKDRVADVADATEYTINRVGEVSLNQQRFTPNDDSSIHGNYFGIYSVVNYMGNLTSDVLFDDPRRYVEGDEPKVDTKSYYEWKVEKLTKRERNNGTSYNQVALASGVFLELTTENSTPSNKVYGDITGVVELDLINVKKDIEGGGYVYARNEHGDRTEKTSFTNVLLSPYNQMPGNVARTKKIYEYSTSTTHDWQTSGNFIHKSKRIVDDCYPTNGVYKDSNGLYKTSPAHYWFIKGEVYIYDQVVSAYAGSASAYSKEVKIPLTITAGSNGKLKLLNVQPNLYAYYADDSRSESNKIPSNGVTVDNERTTFHLNDVITWWDWNQLTDNEKKYFVKDTYVNADPCTIGGTKYEPGTYVLENDPSIHNGDETQTAYRQFLQSHPDIYDSNNQLVTDLSQLFRPSNNIGHDTGYALTVDMNSPKDWDYWYSPISRTNGSKISKETYELPATTQSNYILGPTYTLTGSSGLYGQREYSVGEVITKEVYDDYTSTVGQMSPQPDPDSQATAEPAYVALVDFGNTQAGNAIGKETYDGLNPTAQSNFGPAMICINTIQLGEEEYVLMGELVSETKLDELAQKYFDYNNSKINADKFENVSQAREYIVDHLSPAYYIKKEGLYGGQYFQSGINYGAIKSWCALTDARTNFAFNYDAFDVLVNPNYPGEGHTDTYHNPYDEVKSVEYSAVYTGTGDLTYYDNDGTSHTIASSGSITREAYEKVRNDQMHYTRIAVDAKTETGSATQTVYIVKETIINKGTPFAKGQDISEKDFNNLTPENKDKVAQVEFTKGNTATIHYYCYEDYTPLSTSDFTPESGTRGKEGSIISSSDFTNETFVPNYQKKFSIQGAEPTETTTLYVSRESNAKDVTSEKVISVVYQYTYYETDDEGEGVSLVNELHVLNIHLQLESGAPEIGPLKAPPAVLPGNTVGLKAPSVNPGLYEIITSGWELFDNETDAQLHRNGTAFNNNGTPLYWYQNQKVWLAFYSKTYLGKTYSNYVPLTVANYHDLDAVMKDKEHHLYVDHPDVERNSKIYIDNRECESDHTKSELDLLKDFFDLSVSGLTGHAALNSRVKGGAKLEFILNSDVATKKATWTSIGDDYNCFAGNLHGDGYTISGLDKSLFGKLCGNVYNLGVTGSFTSAGVADAGEGYVENCWIRTTGTPEAGVKAVFNGGTDGSQIDGDRKLLVNCYYPKTNAYKAGLATPMTDTQFYNGTVAYNLNGFYLNKRYYDKQLTSGTEYKYLKSVNGTVNEEMSTGHYPSSYAFYPLDGKNQSGLYGYVENRYADGDFVYAGGTIPDAYDERMRVVTEETTSTVTYAPIWPDDYIYFGQMLTFGYNTSRPHQDLPSRIVKSEGRLTTTDLSNRIYRAPAYYQSKDMDVVHFNHYAYLAAKSAPKTVTDQDLKDAYPNMTAIDFYGHNDNTWAHGFKSEGFAAGSPSFYPPLLDDDEGLAKIVTEGETPNLLVYAPSAEAKASTCAVLNEHFADPVYTSYYINDNYRCVGVADAGAIHGHLIQATLTNGRPTAANDHLLVDKRDFNCPISYTFADGKRMWYQRTPDRYVDLREGWETVSLPFTAELVTTQQKGEITHFYSGSNSIDENGTKIGHEYWLREYIGQKANTAVTNGIFTAAFNYPTASGEDRNVGNTFLWDYYYKVNDQLDANTDTYQTNYNTSRSYAEYPLLATAKPYIIGFPGKTYYEFDLSGDWTAQKTASPAPAKLDKQTISFISKPNITIGISDEELDVVAADNYGFMPNYMSKKVKGYLMNGDGSSFNKTPEGGASTVPFRPYFVKTAAPARTRSEAQYIVFDSTGSSFAIGDKDPSEEETGELMFGVKRHTIIVSSTLRKESDVRIFNVNGQAIAAFDIQPGETVETNVYNSGVYIIRADNGRYTKKIALK